MCGQALVWNGDVFVRQWMHEEIGKVRSDALALLSLLLEYRLRARREDASAAECVGMTDPVFLLLPQFKGLRRLSSLSVAPLDTSNALYAHLVSRGKQYVALTGAAHPAEGGPGVRFLDYDDILIQVVGRGPHRKIFKSRAEGRAVVDVKGYRKMVPGQASTEFVNACVSSRLSSLFALL